LVKKAEEFAGKIAGVLSFGWPANKLPDLENLLFILSVTLELILPQY